jgi:phosphatidylglycerol lysyltransferase
MLPAAPASFGSPDPIRRGGLAWVRLALALAVFVMGAIDVASAVLSHPPERLIGLERFLPTTVLETSRTFTLIAGALLLVTAWGLRRGKRRAFVFALFLCAVSVPVNVLKAIDVEEATVAALLLFALGVSGEAFKVKSRELSWRGWGVLALALGAAFLGAATLGAHWAAARYGGGGAGPASWTRALASALTGLLGLGNGVALPSPAHLGASARAARWFAQALPAIGFGYASFVAILALGPATFRTRHGPEHRRIAEIARAYGTCGVSPFVSDPDLDVFVSPNGRAAIAYRYELGVLLALGDPLGPPEEVPLLLAAFETFCRERDWEFAFFQAAPEALALYGARGWRAIHIGEEPVIDPAAFTLEGSAMGDVRRATARLEREGVRVLSFRPPTRPFDPVLDADAAAVLPGLRAVSNEWLAAHPGGEKSFGMGRFDARQLASRWVMAALSAEGRLEAFATWAEVPAVRGWSLDLTRRRHDAPPGVMDLLVARAALEARDRGDGGLSLGLSALVTMDERADPDADRVRAFLRRRLEPFYDFEGLFHWKKKFDPRFEDRFLVVPGPLSLARVLFALARAQTPGGFAQAWRARRVS